MENLEKLLDTVRDNEAHMIILSDDAFDINAEDRKGNMIRSVLFEVNRQITHRVDEVILIDGGTASASEILASALRINNDVQLVGSTTYGKNTIQKIHKLKDGALVKFTIGEWFNANEKSILEEPLTPDKEVTYIDGSDAALNEALNMF